MPRRFNPAALRRALKRADMTIAALANAVGVSDRLLYYYLTDNESQARVPAADTLFHMADVLGVKPDSLMTRGRKPR